MSKKQNKNIRFVLIIIFLIAFAVLLTGSIFNIFSADAAASNCYWVGDTNPAIWNDATHWSSSAGGAGSTCDSGVVPGIDDTVYFTSDNTNSVTIDNTPDVAAVNIQSGYTGSISISGSLTTAVRGTFTQADGTFNLGTGTLNISDDFTKTGGTFNEDTGTVFFSGSPVSTITNAETFYKLYVNKSLGQILDLNGNTIQVNNTLVFSDGVANNGTLDARENITQGAGADGGTAILVFGNNAVSQTYTLNGGIGPVLTYDSSDDASDALSFSNNSSLRAIDIQLGFGDNTIQTTYNGYSLTISSGNFTQAAGTFNAPAATLTLVSGNFTKTGGTFNEGTGTISFTTDTNVLDVNISETFYNVIVNEESSADYLSLSGDTIQIDGTLTLTNGFVTNGTLDARGNITQGSGSDGGGDAVLVFGNSGSSQTLTVSGGTGPHLTFDTSDDASDNVNFDANGGFYALTIATAFGNNTVPFTYDGFNMTIGTGNFIQQAGILNTPPTLTFASGNFTKTGGTFNEGTNTVAFTTDTNVLDVDGSETFYSVNINQESPVDYLSLSNDTMIVTGTLTLTNGTVGSGTIEAQGDVTTISSFDGVTTPIIFSGDATTQSFNTGGIGTFDADITINKNTGQVNLVTNPLIMNAANEDLVIQEGTFNLNGQNLTVNGTSGTFVVQDGGILKLNGNETITVNASNPSLQSGSTVKYVGTSGPYTLKNYTYHHLEIDGAATTFNLPAALDANGNITITNGILGSNGFDINIGGNWSNSGSFTAGSKTVTFDGTNQSVSGSTTFNNFSKTESSNDATDVTLTFAASATQTIGGLLTLNGLDTDDRINLRSSSDGTYWNLTANGTFAIDYVDTKNSNASGGLTITHTDTISSGHNLNWGFVPDAPTIGTPTAQSTTSIRWNFTDNAADETGFRVHNSSHSVVATCASADLTYCDETGLSINTAYSGRHVHAYNGVGDSTGSADASAIYTLANPPSTPTVNTPATTSLKVTVNVNSNPAATEFAINETTTNQYVQANGSLGASAVWQNYATWGGASGQTVSGLSVNTQYTFKAKARNGDNTETAFSSTASLYTLANTPSAPTVNTPATTSLKVTINTNSNPASTAFAIYTSTTTQYVQADGTLGASAVWQSYATWGGASGQTVSGLTPSTSYTFQVKARNGDNTETSLSTGASETTLNSVPTAPTIGVPQVLSTSSIRWRFTDNASDETGFRVHDSSHSVVATCALVDLTYCDETGLSINTAYSSRHIHAYNGYGDSDPSANASSIYTLAEIPNAPTIDSATTTTLDVTINTNSNPSSTQFAIFEDGTDQYVQADGTLGASAVWQIYSTWGSSAGQTISGLSVNTLYYFKVKARNGDSIETSLSPVTTSHTLANPPTGASHSAQTTSTITWTWSANSNPSGTEFYASDATGNSGWVADATSWTSSGASANTQYTVTVKARNGDNIETTTTTSSAYTLANTPSAPTIDSATTTTLDVTINTNSNPSSTQFAIFEDGTDQYVQADGTLGASAVWQIYSTWGSSAGQTISGLSINTAYTFQVKARNGDSIATSLSASTAAYTLVNTPSATIVSNPSTSTLAVFINQNSNNSVTTYAIYSATVSKYLQADLTLGASAVWQTYSTWGGSYGSTITGLSVNTNYSFQTKARNGDLTETNLSIADAEYTLANTPLAPTLSSATSSSLQLVINENSNNATTEYAIFETTTSKYIQASGTLGSSTIWQGYSTWGGSSGKTIADLASSTTYSFKVKARNSALTETSFSATASLATATASSSSTSTSDSNQSSSSSSSSSTTTSSTSTTSTSTTSSTSTTTPSTSSTSTTTSTTSDSSSSSTKTKEKDDQDQQDQVDDQDPEAKIKSSDKKLTNTAKEKGTFTFDGSESFDDKEIVSYNWIFGDGTEETSQVIKKKFDQTGIYTVTLIVRDSSGNKGRADYEVKVVPPPPTILSIFKKEKKYNFQGDSEAKGLIDLYIYSKPKHVAVNTDQNGDWSLAEAIENLPLEEGEHKAYATVTDENKMTSDNSKEVIFILQGDVIYNIINEGISVQSVSNFISNTYQQGNTIQKTSIITVAATAGVGLIASLIALLGQIFSIASPVEWLRTIIQTFITTLIWPIYRRIKHVKTQYGQVLELGTHQPLPGTQLFIFKLNDLNYRNLTPSPFDIDAEIKEIKQVSKLVTATYTDKYGRFIILVPKGAYFLLISKVGYSPLTIDDQIYKKSNIIEVTKDDTSIAPTIIMEPTPETLEKRGHILDNIYQSERIMQVVIPLLITIGLITVIISSIQNPQFVYYAAIYLIFIMLFLRFFKKTTIFGTVEDQETKNTIPNTMIRITTHDDKLISTAITNSQGKYRLHIRHGSYKIKVAKTNYSQNQEIALDTKTDDLSKGTVIALGQGA